MHNYCKNSIHSGNFNSMLTLTKDTILQQPDHSCFAFPAEWTLDYCLKLLTQLIGKPSRQYIAETHRKENDYDSEDEIVAVPYNTYDFIVATDNMYFVVRDTSDDAFHHSYKFEVRHGEYKPDHLYCYTYNLVPFTTKTFKLTYRKNTKTFYLFEGSTVVCCSTDYDWICAVVLNKLVDKTCPEAYRLKHRIKLSKGYVEWCEDNHMPLVTDGYEPRAYVTLL